VLGDVARIEASDEVQVDPILPALGATGNRDVHQRTRRTVKAPPVPAALAAQHAIWCVRENRRHHVPLERHRLMTEQVDATEIAMKEPPAKPVTDGVPSDSKLQQLFARDRPALSSGDFRGPSQTWLIESAVTALWVDHVWHSASVAGQMPTFQTGA
jgi:hypothetical protein